MYDGMTRNAAGPAKYRSFAPPPIILPLQLPAHDDPWPTSAPIRPVTPLAEPAGQKIDGCRRSREAAAPDYKLMMSLPTGLDEPETPSFLAVIVKWLASVALGCRTQLRCDLDV